MATAKVLIAMADYGHDPTGTSSLDASRTIAHAEQIVETAVPYSAFKQGGITQMLLVSSRAVYLLALRNYSN